MTANSVKELPTASKDSYHSWRFAHPNAHEEPRQEGRIYVSSQRAMIVGMRKGATPEEINGVVEKAKSLGLGTQLNLGTDKTVVALLGSNTGQLPIDIFALLPGVENVARIMKPYKLASREFKPQDSVVSINGIEIGGNHIVVMAGPCAVENEEQLMKAVRAVKEGGACIVRGGAFKPRTSPFSFQGLEKAGLELLARAREQFNIPVITEVVDPHDVSLVSKYADILQVGARNMQNFTLLTEIGKSKHPVVLKRGFSCTVAEWLTAADYLLAGGNSQVILCERGIRTFENSARFSLDVCSIPVIKKSSHLPLIVDPSHAAGHYALVPAIAKAAIAAGADGLLIEVHPNPKEALIDGLQSLTPSDFARLMKELKPIAKVVGRYI
jgi:3-deoxy-7-phosphoheptulonate synthase